MELSTESSVLPTETWPLHIVRPLRASDVYTWEELVNIDPKDLYRYAGFGIKSLSFLEDKLAERGLSFRLPRPNPNSKEKYKTKTSGVYFLKCDQFVKIGRTSHLKSRIVQLRVSIPHEVELVAVQKVESADELGPLERSLHVRFRHLRHHGEWFLYKDEIIDYIATIQVKT